MIIQLTFICLAWLCATPLAIGLENDSAKEVIFDEPVDDVASDSSLTSSDSVVATTFHNSSVIECSNKTSQKDKSATQDTTFDSSVASDSDADSVVPIASKASDAPTEDTASDSTSGVAIADADDSDVTARAAKAPVTGFVSAPSPHYTVQQQQRDALNASLCPKICSPDGCTNAICGNQRNATCLPDLCGCAIRFVTLSADRSSLVDVTAFCGTTMTSQLTNQPANELPVIPDGVPTTGNTTDANATSSNATSGSWTVISPSPITSGGNTGVVGSQLPASSHSGWGASLTAPPVVSSHSWGQQQQTGLGFGAVFRPLSYAQNFMNIAPNLIRRFPFASLALPGMGYADTLLEKKPASDEDADSASDEDILKDKDPVKDEDSVRDEDSDSDEDVQPGSRVKRQAIEARRGGGGKGKPVGGAEPAEGGEAEPAEGEAGGAAEPEGGEAAPAGGGEEAPKQPAEGGGEEGGSPAAVPGGGNKVDVVEGGGGGCHRKCSRKRICRRRRGRRHCRKQRVCRKVCH